MTTAVIQIGNSDDKLTQEVWASFLLGMAVMLKSYGKVHFAGHSLPTAPWQNACWVVELTEHQGGYDMVVAALRRSLRRQAKHYEQDSIALTLGGTEFVEALE